MASLTINDLPRSRALDYNAMASISGAGGEWVFGATSDALRAFASDRSAPIVNLYQTNNMFIADQLNIQFQTIAVDTEATNAVVNVIAGQDASTVKLGP